MNDETIVSLETLKQYLIEVLKNLESLEIKGQKNIHFVYQSFLYANESSSLVDSIMNNIKEKEDKKND